MQPELCGSSVQWCTGRSGHGSGFRCGGAAGSTGMGALRGVGVVCTGAGSYRLPPPHTATLDEKPHQSLLDSPYEHHHPIVLRHPHSSAQCCSNCFNPRPAELSGKRNAKVANGGGKKAAKSAYQLAQEKEDRSVQQRFKREV